MLLALMYSFIARVSAKADTRKGRSRFPIHDMPYRLGEKYATHVAGPCNVVVAVELVDVTFVETSCEEDM